MEAKWEVTGLVLAGGESLRFGVDKARHRVGECTMVAAVTSVVSSVCDRVLVSLGAETSAFEGLEARYVRDSYPGAGPLAGIHAGLQACDTEWLLVAACDLPFLTTQSLHVLLRARRPDLQAVIAKSSDGRLHPLCACYRRDVLSLVEERLSARQLAMHGLIQRLGGKRSVPLPDDAIRNINTPGDLKTAGAALGRHGDDGCRGAPLY